MVDIDFTDEDGKNDSHDIKVYALSTCGFCRRGLNYLRENSFKFKYIYIDMLDYEIKQELKKELYEKYKKRPVFPYLVLDDGEALTGFRKEIWDEALK